MAYTAPAKGTTRGSEMPSAQPGETGDIIPDSRQPNALILNKPTPFAKSWAHFVAGGIGGMTAAFVTAPLDVLKTRLQSDFYQAQLRASRAAAPAAATMGPLRGMAYHLRETVQILATVYRLEGMRALFKGLGPNLVGVVPARSINFFTYGNGKRLIADHLNGGREDAWVHLLAGVTAGVVTSTATNPIWMVKTRLQLDKSEARRAVAGSEEGVEARRRKYKNSLDCVRQIVRDEGVRGLYKGMSASYLGAAESTLQWVMYEQAKRAMALREEHILVTGRERTWWDNTIAWTGNFFAAGAAKLVAATVTYPHEVARTRLRQAPTDGSPPRYTGLLQCFKLVWRQEGLMGLYGGLTPHMLRTVPSAAIMFAMYEGILRLLQTTP